MNLVATGHLPDISGLAAITSPRTRRPSCGAGSGSSWSGAAADPGRRDVERRRCETALSGLDDAALTTLHGFAARLLAEHPLEAELPPGAEVRDAVASALEQDRWWTGWVDKVLDDDDLADTCERR